MWCQMENEKNRELKFRAIIKYQYEPIDDCPIDDMLITYFDLKDFTESKNVITDIKELNYCTILGIIYDRYTGRKDKNKKDIYEYDIIKAPYDDCSVKHKVYFENGCFKLQWTDLDSWAEEDLEIIGNIYEI